MYSIVDCFPYFNEKELLELRVELLKDYVDKFVIVDANFTHSGIPKEFTLKKTIEDLSLPKEKIEVIELDLSDHNLPPASYYEIYHDGPYVKNASRERIQRDAISICLETNDFDEDTIFIVGDCDEIINPKYIKMYKEWILNNRDKIFKVDLVQLEGRADMRAYHKSNPNVSIEWDKSLFLCLRNHMKETSLTTIRADFHIPYHIIWSYDMDKDPPERMRDHGWHFSWMGKNEDRIIKSKSFCHHNQNLEFLNYNNYSSDEMRNFMKDYEFFEGQESPSGNTYHILKRYPLEELPQIIFDLPRVKEFLLPNG